MCAAHERHHRSRRPRAQSQGIDVTIPRDQLVVITGLSGSGKSSLAFDTIYAEGQRRYVESLSAYARQFLDQNAKPDVDSIEGLSPAISIEQKSTSKNPRSTVGTLTEIYDYLRLLYARIGVPHCHQCGKRIESQTVQQIVDTILAMPDRTKFWCWHLSCAAVKASIAKSLWLFEKKALRGCASTTSTTSLAKTSSLDKKRAHTIELVIDRLVCKPDLKQRLTDSVELALKKADGMVRIQQVDGPSTMFCEHFACHDCGVSYPELAPRLFSFNSPFGACPDCDGLGHSMEVDLEKVVPNKTLSLRDGAIAPWNTRWSAYYQMLLNSLCKHFGVSMTTPWNKLPKKFQNAVLGGTTQDIKFSYSREGESYRYAKPFEGVAAALSRKLDENTSDRAREEIEKYSTFQPCSVCQGQRLKPEALAVKVEGQSIQQLCTMPVGDAHAFFKNLDLSKRDAKIAVRILKEVIDRLSFLEAVGLDYLNLDRSSATLSGGEAQRIRLATQIGSALQGVVYVLDEPSIGLHQRDNERLLTTLKRLRDLGNTVLVVEHDEDTIRAADWVIDMGPGAGVEGGRVTAEGPPLAICKNKASMTGAYLNGKRGVLVPAKRRPRREESLWVRGARGNNLKGVDAEFPLGQLICVTGVSGSGKSTLVNDTLHLSLAHQLHDAKALPAAHKRVEGIEHIDKVIDIDQSPIGRTPRSNPATYTQLFGLLRDLFCGLPESRARLTRQDDTPSMSKAAAVRHVRAMASSASRCTFCPMFL